MIYEDQYDGEWDRGWYRFDEMFEEVVLDRYTRMEALKVVLQRFAYRMVWFDTAMVKSFYKIPEKEIKSAVAQLVEEGLPYDHEPLQYLLIEGEFHGASVGHFRNGPYDLNDIVCDLPDAKNRRAEIIEAIRNVNYGKMPERFMGKKI